MTTFERLNLALRVLMETGIVVALAYWGVHTGDSTAAKILLGVGAPVLGFGFWGAVDFRWAQPLSHCASPRSSPLPLQCLRSSAEAEDPEPRRVDLRPSGAAAVGPDAGGQGVGLGRQRGRSGGWRRGCLPP